MEQIIHKIAIDFLRPEKKVIKIAKNDAYSRAFQIAMYANGVPYEPDDSSVLYAVYYSKQDGTAGGYDTMPDNTTPAVTPSGNVLTAQLAPQVTTYPGHVKFGVALYKTTGEQLQTFDIDLIVEDSAGEGEISNDYWNLQSIAGLQNAVTLLQAKCVAMTGATASNDGAPGFVPGPQHGEQNDVLHGDGTWRPVQVYAEDVGVQVVIGGQNCDNVDEALQALAAGGGGGGIVPVMQPASAESDGAAGLVPKPTQGKQNTVLHGDATWRGISADDIGVQAQKLGAETVQDAISELEDIVYNQPETIAETAIVHSINHRGYNTEAPENTLPAFLLSKARGFAMVETDVCFTSDGVAVLLHDDTINRTARNSDGTALSSTVRISDITYAQALEYDFGIWKDAKYAGTRIPTLEEFLQLCKDNALHPYIEMKNSGVVNGQVTAEMTALLRDSAVAVAKDMDMLGRITWISFSAPILAKLAELDAVSRLGYIVSHGNNGGITDTVIQEVRAIDPTLKRVFIDSSNYTAAEISRCKAVEIPLEIWTLDDWTGVSLDPYITGVTSNYRITEEVMQNAAAKRKDAALQSIPYIRANGLDSSGSDSTAGADKEVLSAFLPVQAGEVYELHYRLPYDASNSEAYKPVIRYAFYDEKQRFLSHQYISTKGSAINGYRNRKEEITVAADGYLRFSVKSYDVASYGLIRKKTADGVLTPSICRIALERLEATDAQAAAMAAQITPMTGATAQVAGTAGLVPAPASGKHAQFLRGDGTWNFPESGNIDLSNVETINGNTPDTVDEALWLLNDYIDTLVSQLNTALAAVVGGGSNG